MTNLGLDQLVEDLKSCVTSEENKLIVASLAVQLTRVSMLAATDPEAAEREMAHIKAAAVNLTAAEAVAVRNKVTDWVSAVVRRALFGA